MFSKITRLVGMSLIVSSLVFSCSDDQESNPASGDMDKEEMDELDKEKSDCPSEMPEDAECVHNVEDIVGGGCDENTLIKICEVFKDSRGCEYKGRQLYEVDCGEKFCTKTCGSNGTISDGLYYEDQEWIDNEEYSAACSEKHVEFQGVCDIRSAMYSCDTSIHGTQGLMLTAFEDCQGNEECERQSAKCWHLPIPDGDEEREHEIERDIELDQDREPDQDLETHSEIEQTPTESDHETE